MLKLHFDRGRSSEYAIYWSAAPLPYITRTDTYLQCAVKLKDAPTLSETTIELSTTQS